MKKAALHSAFVGWLTTMIVVFSSCNATKFVPQDKMLLNKARIVVTDTRDVQPTDLRHYLRQTQNQEIFGFWKLQLHIYNTAPLDTTTKSKKRLAHNAFKMGEAPEVFSEDLASSSMQELTRAMQNKGYFDATVDTTMAVKDRKLSLTYLVTANEPYRLRHVASMLTDYDLKRFGVESHESLLKRDMLFDADVLNNERARIASEMRRHGYFYFEKEMLRFTADSTVGHKQVDVEISLQPYMETLSDTTREKIFSIYSVGQVYFHMDYDPNFVEEPGQLLHSSRGNYNFTWTGHKLLREKALIKHCQIKPGDIYDEHAVEETYEEMNALGVIKYVDIAFVPSDKDPNILDCHIVIARRKLNTVSAEIEGTYSEGDWGIAAGLGYANKDIFRGAEELSIKANGGYEWRKNGGCALELKGQAQLRFPNQLAVGLEYNYQKRPDEFTRTIANASLGFSIHHKNSPWRHTFKFVDISYVYLPSISDEFRERFLQPTNIMKYSYEDHFIVAFSYALNYSSFRESKPYQSYGTFRLMVETSGNVMDGIARLAKVPVDENGQRKIFGINYAQYFKADFDFSYHGIIDEHHRIVVHGALGCAIPYGNAKIIPFEKRYFSGGANSVRGWAIRSLGPGSYHGTGNKIDYNSQAGDIRLDLNLEYRYHIWSIFEVAAFTDAGNIWTLYDYESQPHGAISKDFLTEVAWSYGVGLRLNFNIFVFRIDFGVKLYDPSRIHYDGKPWRTAANGLCWKDDMAFQFAIGYPF